MTDEKRPECVPPEAKHVVYWWEWRTLKRCVSCGRERRIRVRYYPHDDRTSYNERCAACELERSARVHDLTAAKLRRQAAQLRRRWATRTGKPS